MAGYEDPMNFITAEDYFGKTKAAPGPSTVVSAVSSKSRDPKDPLRYAVLLTFDDKTTCLIQYVMPQMWRIRYDPTVSNISGYPDANTRTIVQQSFSHLVDVLQAELRVNKATNSPDVDSGSAWGTTLQESSDQRYWIFSSVEYQSENDALSNTNGQVCTKMIFNKSPFKIQAVRILKSIPDPDQMITGEAATEKVVWQTSARPFVHKAEPPCLSNVQLNVVKPPAAKYIGFGEQGGSSFTKHPSFMNYFCYDNLGYSKVYNKGPLDTREPLYHSQPFFLQLNGNPTYANVTGMMVDNYSQVFIDLGKTEAHRVGLGVRFGALDTYVMSTNQVSEMIWLFTSIVGRPRLKPRYVLGHHQGGYGYETRGQIEDVVNNYRKNGIPLDGLHIDVDFQHKYRTFTVDEGKFPKPDEMFTNFKQKGIKCCTNITPIISFDGYRTNNDPYSTINQAWDQDHHTDPSKNFLIMDKRYFDGLKSKAPQDQRYLRYNGGQVAITNPNDLASRPGYKDPYNFEQNFNSGFPFHGGVSYGDILGVTGYYPDLNRQVVREKFWPKQYEDLFNKGLEFVWQDMTTPAVHECYGDMLGFPARLLVSTDPYDQTENVLPPPKTAMEIWALYSYNLHKATYKALDNLPTRKNKRNFIIGRGSSTGMHRYAGLWTGDNMSTWDFWRISVAQVLSCGYGGISIAGVDMGGFMPDGKAQWCDPDLMIRWYSGAFLLPWYRNHYNGKQGQKLFQEVYRYATVLQDPSFHIPPDQHELYNSVMPICRYFVKLRYSLMQALYDRMFENLISGLPIARAMLITDPDDGVLYNDASTFLDNQYLMGHYILVCPIMDPDHVHGGMRDIYLPRPNNWFSFNLRIDGSIGVPLDAPVSGGSFINYGSVINSDPNHTPYITPIYIREGGIIPQVEPRDCIGDGKVNPITLHIFPGQDNWYSMYLDDGVSRSSAPMDIPQYSLVDDHHNPDAKGEYREVKISQKTAGKTRTVTLEHVHDNYAAEKDIGSTYTIVLWYVAQRDGNNRLLPLSPPPSVTFTDRSKAVEGCSSNYRPESGATVVKVPTSLAGGHLVITQTV